MATSFLGKFDVPLVLEFDGGFWVKYRSCLTGGQRDWLRAKYYKRVTENGTVRLVTDDPFVVAREETHLSIVEWNLTGLDGEVLPYDHDIKAEIAGGQRVETGLRRSWPLLPAHVQDRITGAVAEAEAEPSREENARFPEGGVGGGSGGEDVGSDDQQSVVDGELVAEVRDSVGSAAGV